MTTKERTTKITVKLFQPMYAKFSKQLAAMPLLKDAFIEQSTRSRSWRMPMRQSDHLPHLDAM